MKHAYAILTILSLLVPLQGMLAQPVKAKTAMTLRDCLLYAREHAHANRINRLETEAASADKRLAASDLMPYIGLGSSGSLSFGRNIDPETNTYDNNKTLSTSFVHEM